MKKKILVILIVFIVVIILTYTVLLLRIVLKYDSSVKFSFDTKKMEGNVGDYQLFVNPVFLYKNYAEISKKITINDGDTVIIYSSSDIHSCVSAQLSEDGEFYLSGSLVVPLADSEQAKIDENITEINKIILEANELWSLTLSEKSPAS
jgi:flagellar basal body-associated protein FliL